MIKLLEILSRVINESDIDKDNIFPYKFDSKSENDIGESDYVYSFQSPKNKYIVQFSSEGAGFYERIFSATAIPSKDDSSTDQTRKSNLDATGENIARKIYRTVTTITLDFLDRANKDHSFNTLIIEPISDKRLSVVKKFMDEYIAPKYKVDVDGKLIVITNK